jgi:hypothetical protein
MIENPTSFKDIIGVIGGVLGAVAFFWKIGDALIAYLHIDLKLEKVSSADGSSDMTALATIENKGSIAKPLHYAALLIGPEGEDFETMAKSIVKEAYPDTKDSLNYLNTMFQQRAEKPIFTRDKHRALIPLPFFFRDQIQIGNEVIKYRCPINENEFDGQNSYTVIFFVFIRYPLGILRWRVTSDLMKIK